MVLSNYWKLKCKKTRIQSGHGYYDSSERQGFEIIWFSEILPVVAFVSVPDGRETFQKI